MVNQVVQEDCLIYLFLMSIIELDLLWNFVLDRKMMVLILLEAIAKICYLKKNSFF
jgi:hypothetical protein